MRNSPDKMIPHIDMPHMSVRGKHRDCVKRPCTDRNEGTVNAGRRLDTKAG